MYFRSSFKLKLIGKFLRFEVVADAKSFLIYAIIMYFPKHTFYLFLYGLHHFISFITAEAKLATAQIFQKTSRDHAFSLNRLQLA